MAHNMPGFIRRVRSCIRCCRHHRAHYRHSGCRRENCVVQRSRFGRRLVRQFNEQSRPDNHRDTRQRLTTGVTHQRERPSGPAGPCPDSLHLQPAPYRRPSRTAMHVTTRRSASRGWASTKSTASSVPAQPLRSVITLRSRTMLSIANIYISSFHRLAACCSLSGKQATGIDEPSWLLPIA